MLISLLLPQLSRDIHFTKPVPDILIYSQSLQERQPVQGPRSADDKENNSCRVKDCVNVPAVRSNRLHSPSPATLYRSSICDLQQSKLGFCTRAHSNTGRFDFTGVTSTSWPCRRTEQDRQGEGFWLEILAVVRLFTVRALKGNGEKNCRWSSLCLIY